MLNIFHWLACILYTKHFESCFYTHLQVVGGIVEDFISIFFRNRNSKKLQGVDM